MGLIGDLIMKFLSYIMPFVLKRHYTSKKLAEMVRITINSEHDGLDINCGEMASAKIWMEVSNQLPFPIEIQAISVTLIWGGTVGQFISIERREIQSHSYERILVDTTLTTEQANYICKNHSNCKPRLSVLFELNSRVRSFSISGREITTSNFEVYNCNN